MPNHANGYTVGYTKPILGRKGTSCDEFRKHEKKRRGQRGPRRQTEQTVAPHAPGTPPPDRSMMTDDWTEDPELPGLYITPGGRGYDLIEGVHFTRDGPRYTLFRFPHPDDYTREGA